MSSKKRIFLARSERTNDGSKRYAEYLPESKYLEAAYPEGMEILTYRFRIRNQGDGMLWEKIKDEKCIGDTMRNNVSEQKSEIRNFLKKDLENRAENRHI